MKITTSRRRAKPMNDCGDSCRGRKGDVKTFCDFVTEYARSSSPRSGDGTNPSAKATDGGDQVYLLRKPAGRATLTLLKAVEWKHRPFRQLRVFVRSFSPRQHCTTLCHSKTSISRLHPRSGGGRMGLQKRDNRAGCLFSRGPWGNV